MLLIDYTNQCDSTTQYIHTAQPHKQLMSIDEIAHRIRIIQADQLSYNNYNNKPLHTRTQSYDHISHRQHNSTAHRRSESAPVVMNAHSTGHATYKPLLQRYISSRVGFSARHRLDNNQL